MSAAFTPLFAPLEFALNKALAFDPDIQPLLANFDGQRISVHVLDIKLQVHVTFEGDKLRLSAGEQTDSDLTISGNAVALARLGHDPDQLFSDDITINGDVQFAKQLQDLLDQFEFDWERQLAKVTGDALAYPIAHGLRQFGQWARQSHESMQLNVSEYLKEEALLLPDCSQVTPFLSEVDALRADVDRLSARIDKLLKSAQ